MYITVQTQAIAFDDLARLIDFDDKYLFNVMKEMSVPEQQLPPPFTLLELEDAFRRNDKLEWVLINEQLAGYFWFEKKSDCLFISGVALKPNFYGMGLSRHILNLAEEKAKESHLTLCRLTVIPLNGRAVHAYLKHGYKITACDPEYFGPDYPGRFRFIMEKNLSATDTPKTATDKLIIACTDQEKLKHGTDNGYVGVRIIQGKEQNNFENKIEFERIL